MSIFKRGSVYWYEFQFHGVRVRESTKTANKELALRAERERRRKLELGANALDDVKRPKPLGVAGDEWLQNHPHWSPNTTRINQTHCDHIMPVLGRWLVNEISAPMLAKYQIARTREGASPKTVNHEVAAIRHILKEEGCWARLDGKVKMLAVREEVGRALTEDEMLRIEIAARRTRSRSLPVALTLFKFTGMRLGELRTMRWRQVDLLRGFVVTGKGKTRAGEGRKIPLNRDALEAISGWRSKFPDANPSHFVFPSERYGLDGENGHRDGDVAVYDIQPDRPISSWKTAWDRCRRIAGVQCRMHDFRHSFVSRLAESPDVSDSTLMALTGHVSKRMLDHYTHSRDEAKRRAVELLSRRDESPQNPPQ